jgi:hypothetical protein
MAFYEGKKMRKNILICALFGLTALFFPEPARAQYLGNVGLQTVDATLATNLACTNANQNFTTGVTPSFPNLGQTSHAAYLLSSNIANGTMVIQGSMDGSTFQNISEVATIAGFIVGTPNSFVVGSGRYTLLRVVVNCGTPGTFSLSYSGSQAPPGALYGSQLLTQFDKTIVTGLTMGSNFLSNTFQPPFGSSLGTLYFKSLVNPPGGSSIAVQCFPGVAVGGPPSGLINFSNPIVVTTALQIFQIPAQACSSMTVSFTSGGASGNAYYVDYLFSYPGQPPIADPCQSPGIIKSSLPITAAAAGTTKIITESGNLTIYVCGYQASQIATAATVQWITGTGATCGTGTVNKSAAMGVTASQPFTYGPGSTLFSGAPGAAVCMTTTGAGGTVGGIVTFVQQ